MYTTLIIPALNEAECIGRLLAAIPLDTMTEILVVDGGSQDDTLSIAEAAHARVIRETRRGYGQACATGVAHARGEIVVFLDADGADDPGHLPELLAPIVQGQAELALGSRLAGRIEPGAMPWHQHIGNWLAAEMIHRLYGLPLTDLSPFRAVRRARLLELDMQEMTYGWPTEMITKAARHKWRIVEVPVTYHPRLGGKSKISGTLRGTVLATYFILRTILRYSRE
jgi:glycosyltransferase involved in cell wall biosynthesis